MPVNTRKLYNKYLKYRTKYLETRDKKILHGGVPPNWILRDVREEHGVILPSLLNTILDIELFGVELINPGTREYAEYLGTPAAQTRNGHFHPSRRYDGTGNYMFTTTIEGGAL
jgi:hypothetical protein